MKYVVAFVAVAALLSIVNAQQYCSGVNMTMSPGVQPNNGASISQDCPYGYAWDKNQQRCLTYRQIVNNFLYTPCHVDTDCGLGFGNYTLYDGTSIQIMKCGTDKTCTWYYSRAQNDSCTDNANCAPIGGSITQGCDISTRKCRIQTYVSVGVGSRCNYAVGADYYSCDSTSTCVFTPTKSSVYGAGNCVALLKQGDKCFNNADGLYCGGGLICSSPFPTGTVNYTCIPQRKLGESCLNAGSTSECEQTTSAYCHATTKVCTAYQQSGQNCTNNYGIDTCSFDLTCAFNGGSQLKCWGRSWSNETCALNCATGLQCVNSYMSGRCFAGNVTDPCEASGQGTQDYKDTCKWEPQGLYFCDAERNSTCQARIPIGGSCKYLQQCASGLQCYNQTCTAFQQLGQPCNTLNTDPLKYLQCTAGLQCSRGVCINNYTVSVDGLCTQDLDCDTSYCDPNVKRCTRRKMCTSTGSGCTCVCSNGHQNPGQCIMNNCGKQERALLTCLNPLLFDTPYYTQTNKYRTSVNPRFALLDSNSAFYQRCQNQHQDWVRCQGIMNKWGAPSMGLGDLINYDLSTVSASSSVSLSIMVVVAFIMSAFMYL